jgi:hypothetical protein
MTVSIKHTLNLVTEVDENHPTAKMLLSLSYEEQVAMLESMARQLLVDNSINELNEGNTFAVLKVAE